MADHLGVVFNERNASKSSPTLPVPAGILALYAVRGATDKGYLCRNEDDITRMFGEPVVEMRDGVAGAGSFRDLNRGLHLAYNLVRNGQPLYISRAIPSTISGGNNSDGKAYVGFQKDTTPDLVKAIAKGHGEWYNDLKIVVKGIEQVQREITLAAGVAASLDDLVLPGTLVVSDPAVPADDDDDTDAVYGIAVGDTAVLSTTLSGNLTVLYEHATEKVTKLTAANSCTLKISYERTTAERVVRLYICGADETDPVNNNYENYIVSFKESGKDEVGRACFIEDVINDVSDLVIISVASAYDQTVIPLASSATAYDGNLTSGQNGTYSASDTDIKTALQFFRDRTKYDFVYCFDCGYADIVKTELGLIASDVAAAKRKPFATALIDPPYSIFMDSINKAKTGLVETKVVDLLCNWRMGLGSQEFSILTGSTWGLITDDFNGGRKLWMPPSYKVAVNSVIVDNTLGSWNSVGGPRRGVVDFEKIAINLYNYIDQLNAKQVNPLIIDERGAQMFYGNKTLALIASAMQQAHARKTRGRISREMYFTALDYVMENLVGSTFNSIRDDFELILEKYGEALESYSLVVQPSATAAADANNQIMRIQVGLIFNQIAEEINITTTVYKNGTDLSVGVS